VSCIKYYVPFFIFFFLFLWVKWLACLYRICKLQFCVLEDGLSCYVWLVVMGAVWPTLLKGSAFD